jgi:hypothetical protein
MKLTKKAPLSVILLVLGLVCTWSVQAASPTHLGKMSWKTDPNLTTNKWNKDRTGPAIKKAPGGKIFLIVSFDDTSSSTEPIKFASRDFLLTVEGEAKALEPYAITAGINAASSTPMFTIDAWVGDYKQKKGAPFSVAFLIADSLTKALLDVKGVKNTITW